MVTRRISYRPTWTDDLTAPVNGERSPLLREEGLGRSLDSRGPGRGRGRACPPPAKRLLSNLGEGARVVVSDRKNAHRRDPSIHPFAERVVVVHSRAVADPLTADGSSAAEVDALPAVADHR